MARQAQVQASATASLAVLGVAASALAWSHSSTATATAPPMPTPPPSQWVLAEPPTDDQPAPATTDDSGLKRFAGPVGNDLSQALDAAGVPARLAREYVRQMLATGGIGAGLSVADRFDLVVALPEGGAPVLVYAGLDRVGRGDVQLFKYGDGRQVRWLDAAGTARDENGFVIPVGGRVTSGFGGRMHPLLHTLRFHKGVDLAARYGAPIAAAADGKVVRAGWAGGYGNQVALAHAGGLQTRYAHMSRIVALPGQAVRRGQVIGYVGSTGLSTGPHLHFEVMRNGTPINPLSAKLASPVALDGDQLHAFRDQLRFVLMLPIAGA